MQRFRAMCCASEPTVNHVLVRWDNRVRFARDNKDAELPGLLGRVYLLNDDDSNGLDAHGTIVVEMRNTTACEKGILVAEWRFDQETLKQLKRKDIAGEGYTLFLPWESYRAEVKKVKLMVSYLPKKGSPQLADASVITLQTLAANEPAAYCQAAQVSPGCAKDIHGNVHTARTGSLMLGCGINSDNGVCGNPALAAGKTPPCCCAKACTCCEACKAAKKETAQELRTKTIYLRNALAADVANAMTKFIMESHKLPISYGSNPPEKAPDIVVVAEPITNSVLVSAPPKLFDEVKSLIAKLDVEPAKAELLVYPKQAFDKAPVPAWNPFGVVRVQAQEQQLQSFGQGQQGYLDVGAPFGAASCPPTQCAPVRAQVVPAQTVRVMQVAHQAKPVRLVTPDLEAHCERMQHQGDIIVLEGNVLLHCKKHAQPIRIEAQRVRVNMRDGSFTVESNAQPVAPAGASVPSGTGFRSTIPVYGPMPISLDFGFPILQDPNQSSPTQIFGF